MKLRIHVYFLPLTDLAFHHMPQNVLTYGKMGPTSDVRGFRWFHPKI